MIVDDFKHAGDYRKLGPKFERAFEYLKETDFSALADGMYEIEGKQMWALLTSFETESEEARKFEAHRTYIDVQYLLKGNEIMYWSPVEALFPDGAYSEEKDIIFFEGSGSTALHLSPGRFVAFFPQDAHKACCQWKEPEEVRKVVVKIMV
jgi:YhcH/YjgK/YiaL family protein